MADKLIIVHGYSDGSASFDPLKDMVVAENLYKEKNVHFIDYASMDDDATYEDFADKLNDDYNQIFNGDRVDVICHSTGALVTRKWLEMRWKKACEIGQEPDVPVEHLFMFAPANFGSDLAKMGQSFFGRVRTSIFNKHSHKDEDFGESGEIVLQGLEPASPFQWNLSMFDLHNPRTTYFGKGDDLSRICFPFIFSAGENYKGLQSKVIRKRKKTGTDGTVRICGTSLNTRKCTIRFNRLKMTEVKAVWDQERKFDEIAFAVFQGFNHGSIVDISKKTMFKTKIIPLLKKAKGISSVDGYTGLAKEFAQKSAKEYKSASGKYKRIFQQFFFKVRDDAGFNVKDYYIDFYVKDKNGKLDEKLTEEWDDKVESKFYKHSEDKSHRALLLDFTAISKFKKLLDKKKAKFVFDIAATPPYRNIKYRKGYFVLYDGANPSPSEETTFLYPNTTTLVEIIINREQDDKILNVTNNKHKRLIKRK